MTSASQLFDKTISDENNSNYQWIKNNIEQYKTKYNIPEAECQIILKADNFHPCREGVNMIQNWCHRTARFSGPLLRFYRTDHWSILKLLVQVYDEDKSTFMKWTFWGVMSMSVRILSPNLHEREDESDHNSTDLALVSKKNN